jgi:DNA invertase Pin-like site-specific DNA recombinase
MEKIFVPAAQYLRMSTEHQQYSFANQADAIARYATEHGFQIVKTYSDGAKSGLRITNRPGLRQVLKDVVDGKFGFNAILVYDVSRWGRFQDADESAHYEYICKSTGVPVHYCAEIFANDNSVSGLIVKAVKRTMAGEYSRELSVKVKAGLVRLTGMGYKAGGCPPYGMRRMLLDVHGRPKQLLSDGERKSLATERVILVPGPEKEVMVVQRIFREYADENRSLTEIARRLNKEKTPFIQDGKWTASTVSHALERPQYMGTHVWGRTTAYLSGPAKKVAPDHWAVCPNAFRPIVNVQLFERARKRLANVTYRLSDEELLNRLKSVALENGKLTSRIIQNSRLCPAAEAYRRRFGGLMNVYALLGYNTSELIAQATARLRAMIVRRLFIQQFLDCFVGQIEEVRATKRFRPLLRVRKTGLLISVVVARFQPTIRTRQARWLIEPSRHERKRTTILGLMNDLNAAVTSIRVFRKMNYGNATNLKFALDHPWWQTGNHLEQISDLFAVSQRYSPIETRVRCSRKFHVE